jgi:hypothetical protein
VSKLVVSIVSYQAKIADITRRAGLLQCVDGALRQIATLNGVTFTEITPVHTILTDIINQDSKFDSTFEPHRMMVNDFARRLAIFKDSVEPKLAELVGSVADAVQPTLHITSGESDEVQLRQNYSSIGESITNLTSPMLALSGLIDYASDFEQRSASISTSATLASALMGELNRVVDVRGMGGSPVAAAATKYPGVVPATYSEASNAMEVLKAYTGRVMSYVDDYDQRVSLAQTTDTALGVALETLQEAFDVQAM